MAFVSIEEGIKHNGYHLSTIVGDSMMPLLRNRKDMVKVVPAAGKLCKYDIPLYKRPTGEYVLHRIVKVKKDHYVICGDNRLERENVPFDWVVGVAWSIYRGDNEIQLSDKRCVRYAKKVCRSYWPRRIRRKVGKCVKWIKKH